MAKTLNRKNQIHVLFKENVLKHIDQMYDLVSVAMKNMISLLEELEEPENSKVIVAYNKEREINNLRNNLRNSNIDNINNQEYDYQEGIFFMDLVGEAEKLGDYVLNVVEGVQHQFRRAPGLS